MLLLAGAIGFIVFSTIKLEWHPFLALLVASLGYGVFAGLDPVEVAESINAGFGKTTGHIGIVILCGTIIGVFLERSGGAKSLAEATSRLTGERNVPLTMGAVGYVVSLPVYCDSGYILLAPLNRALSARTGASVAAGAVALSLGLYATHTMVPPTPGPVAAAGILEADLGEVIGLGLVASLVALFAGWLFATRYAARFQLTGKPSTAVAPPTEDLPQPSALRAATPILLPIVLIVLASVGRYPSAPLGSGPMVDWLVFMGQPVVALLVGAFTSFTLGVGGRAGRTSRAGWVKDGVTAAASVIVITGAGGAFGEVLQRSGIAVVVEDLLPMASLGIWLPFLLAAGIKSAQGSSTVAIITTAGIVAPLAVTLGLDAPLSRALAVVAIGAGAMVVSHANDSYFWVVTQFSGMTLEEGLRLQTLGTAVEGFAAATAVWLLSLVI